MKSTTSLLTRSRNRRDTSASIARNRREETVVIGPQGPGQFVLLSENISMEQAIDSDDEKEALEVGAMESEADEGGLLEDVEMDL